MHITIFSAINNCFVFANHKGSETLSYCLGFYYVSTQILGISFYIKQDKRGHGLVKGKSQIPELKNKSLALAGVVQLFKHHCLVRESCESDSWSGHITGLQVQYQVQLCRILSESVWEASNGCFSLTSKFLCLPSSLSRSNEKMSFGEDFKKCISYSHHNTFILSKQQYVLNIMIGQGPRLTNICPWTLSPIAWQKCGKVENLPLAYSGFCSKLGISCSHTLVLISFRTGQTLYFPHFDEEKKKKCFHTGHLLRTHRTCYNFYESCAAPRQKRPPR